MALTRTPMPDEKKRLNSLVSQNWIIAAVSALLAMWLFWTLWFAAACAALSIYSGITASGLRKLEPKAYKMSAFTPFFSLIIWAVPVTAVAVMAALFMNGMEGTGAESQFPAATAIVSLVFLPAWLLLTWTYFRTRTAIGHLF